MGKEALQVISTERQSSTPAFVLPTVERQPVHPVDRIPFKGFGMLGHRKAEIVRNQMKTIGLPVNNVTEVIYAPNPKRQENLLGTFQPFNGKLTLYKSLTKLPPEAQQETIAHE